MAQKVARLTAANTQAEKANATLMRELAELREEKAVMARIFQEQLDQVKQSVQETRAENLLLDVSLERLRGPPDESAAAEELQQLEEELLRVRQAGESRLESKTRENEALRLELERRVEQQHRLSKVCQAMSASAESDLNELATLKDQVQQLEAEKEDLEADCFKMHCQVEALSVRLTETRRQTVEGRAHLSAVESLRTSSLHRCQENVASLLKQLAEADEFRENLKAKTAELKNGIFAEPERRERGAQTRYLSDQLRLQEQVESLTRELERARSAASTGAGTGNTLSSWLSLCLRPQFGDERPRALGSGRPPSSAALANSEAGRLASQVPAPAGQSARQPERPPTGLPGSAPEVRRSSASQ